MNASLERLKGRFSYGSRPRPYRDWFFILAALVALLILSFSWNAWIFLRVAAGESIGGTAATSTAPAWNAATLEAVDALYANRAEEAARYQSQYPFVDPSK
jgi:hypothetical protein